MQKLCEIAPLTIEVHKETRLIAEQYGSGFYDSCTIAFALLEDCEIPYSEDMQHGKVIFDAWPESRESAYQCAPVLGE